MALYGAISRIRARVVRVRWLGVPGPGHGPRASRAGHIRSTAHFDAARGAARDARDARGDLTVQSGQPRGFP